jgi:hypothetical protein
MRRASFEQLNCSVAQTLEVGGDWWSLLIVRDIFFGVTRFDDIQRRLGIARNTLADRLNWLSDHGVVTRQEWRSRRTAHRQRQNGPSSLPRQGPHAADQGCHRSENGAASGQPVSRYVPMRVGPPTSPPVTSLVTAAISASP